MRFISRIAQSARVICLLGIFTQHEPLAKFLQTKTQRGERPNGNPYDYMLLSRFTKFPWGRSQERSKHGAFRKKNLSWEITGPNSRDAGPGCDHHFIAWHPCQLPSILPAFPLCTGSPPGSWLHAQLFLAGSFPLRHKPGTPRSWPDLRRSGCKRTGSITDCQACSSCPRQRRGEETIQ